MSSFSCTLTNRLTQQCTLQGDGDDTVIWKLQYIPNTGQPPAAVYQFLEISLKAWNVDPGAAYFAACSQVFAVAGYTGCFCCDQTNFEQTCKGGVLGPPSPPSESIG